MRNLKRTAPLLLGAALSEENGNDELEELYDRLLEQWTTELGHVLALIGGVEAQEKENDQPGVRFTPLSRARQRAALDFLNQNAFRTPDFFVDERMLRRLEPEGAVRRLSAAQAGVLSDLLENDRLLRLTEYESFPASRANAYPLNEMLTDLRRGIWSELSSSYVKVDVFRRNLQRSYLARAGEKINGGSTAPGVIVLPSGEPSKREPAAMAGPDPDARALFRAQLQQLDSEISAAAPRAADASTRAHLIDSRAQIDRILHPPLRR